MGIYHRITDKIKNVSELNISVKCLQSFLVRKTNMLKQRNSKVSMYEVSMFRLSEDYITKNFEASYPGVCLCQ